MTAGKAVGAVVAAIRILRHLSEAQQPLASNRIARELGLNPSTCFNILKTLDREGVTFCDPETKRHRLGLGLVELAGSALGQLGYKDLIHPHLERLARVHGVAATLWLRSGSERVVLVDIAESGSPVKIAMSIGQRLPFLSGALGRCFAAHSGLSRAELRRHFDRVRWERPPAFDTFMEQAREAARIGYAVDAGHFAGGVTTISSPVLDAEGRPRMALSVVTFSTALDDASMAVIGRDLADTAQVVGRAVGSIPELLKAP